ncbi:MAG: VWA domain-containing protein [Candidatus Acidiferrales bacterium]
MVAVYAVVRDKHGKVVPTLKKADFTLSEDGRPQKITYFMQQNDVPLTLGLLVDTSMSEANELESERNASFTFVDDVMREDKDHAFVIHFDREVELLQDVTASNPKLQAALQCLQLSIGTAVTTSAAGTAAAIAQGERTFMMRFTWLRMNRCPSKRRARKQGDT